MTNGFSAFLTLWKEISSDNLLTTVSDLPFNDDINSIPAGHNILIEALHTPKADTLPNNVNGCGRPHEHRGKSEDVSSSCKMLLCNVDEEAFDKLNRKKQLLIYIRMKKRIESVVYKCNKKLSLIEKTYDAKPIRYSAVINFAQRLAPHTRAPPEYNDPTGANPYCVPGFFFPCPDKQMITRSALYHTNVLRVIPPTISFHLDPSSYAIYNITITTSTPDATLYYCINNGNWIQYIGAPRPQLCGQGQYTVRAYGKAEGLLTSEVSISDFELSEVPPTTEASSAELTGMIILQEGLNEVERKISIEEDRHVLAMEGVARTDEKAGEGDINVIESANDVLPMEFAREQDVEMKGQAEAQTNRARQSSTDVFSGLFLGDSTDDDDDSDD